MTKRNRPAVGAISAVPDSSRPGGVLYTMLDGSKIEVYNKAGEQGNFAYRTNNPGIQTDPGGKGIIGYVPHITKKGAVLNYPVYATPDDAREAVLRTLDRINTHNEGPFTVKEVLGGDNRRYNWDSSYYEKYIESQLYLR